MNRPTIYQRHGPAAALMALWLTAVCACALPNSALPPATPAPTAVSTQPPPASATPAPAATAASTSAPTAADCDNVYLPSSEGSTWTYSSTNSLSNDSGGRTVTTTKVKPDSFYHEVQLVQPPLHYEVSWQCTAEGLIQFGGGVLASLTASGEVQIDFLQNTGVTLPSVINIGDTWSQTTEFQMTSESINGVGRWIGNSTAVGPEAITVPAGSFNTMRIDSTLQTESDPYPSTNQTVDSSSWYAPEVGLVKSTSHIYGETVDYTYEMVLVSYTIP